MEWFSELSGRRTSGPHGPNPITFHDIEAWARLTGRDPRPFEVRLIARLDDAIQERATARAREAKDNHGELAPAGDGGKGLAALMMSLPKKPDKPVVSDRPNAATL